MKTLLLDLENWDLCIDASGNIALAAEPYAIAQDVASAVRTFQGECWYDTTKGIPYLTGVLGQAPSPAYYKAQVIAAALTVPTTASAVCYLSAIVGRQLTGQVQVTTTDGVTVIAATGTGNQFLLDYSLLGGPNVLL
ncbi:MAG: hypothetical protein ACYDD1_02280 [Caulobacteraceae bacterium]